MSHTTSPCLASAHARLTAPPVVRAGTAAAAVRPAAPRVFARGAGASAHHLPDHLLVRLRPAELRAGARHPGPSPSPAPPLAPNRRRVVAVPHVRDRRAGRLPSGSRRAPRPLRRPGGASELQLRALP